MAYGHHGGMGSRHDIHGICHQLLGFIGCTMVPWSLRSWIVSVLLFCVINSRFPGVQFYLSCWYKRKEFGLRSAIFFSAAALSGSFGGLLAAAIANMKGLGGKQGWAWIVILLLLLVFANKSSFWRGC
jgi:hypothetical protein